MLLFLFLLCPPAPPATLAAAGSPEPPSCAGRLGGEDDDAFLPQALGQYNRELHALHELLTVDEERELFAKYQKTQDPKARHKLLYSQLPLAIHVAKRYQGKGLALEDLVQEANLGLLEALERFDLEKQARFSSYSTWWMRKAILEALRNSGQIRVPDYIQKLVALWRRSHQRLAFELGRPPTNDEVAAVLGIDVKKKRYRYLLLAWKLYVGSRFGRSRSGDDKDFLASCAAPDTVDPLDALASLEDFPMLLARMEAVLKPRDREILLDRFGISLDGTLKEPMTLEAIGNRLGLTKDGVRRAQNAALAKLAVKGPRSAGDLPEEETL